MDQISQINKFVKNIRTAGLGTSDSTLINLGEPRSVKLTRISSQDIDTESRTTDPDLMASYVNITRDETSMTADPETTTTLVNPTTGKHSETYSAPKAPASPGKTNTNAESQDQHLLVNCPIQLRQAEVMTYIAHAHEIYIGEHPAAQLYKKMPMVDAEVLVKRSWSQIIENFPQVQDAICNPENAVSISSLLQPIHGFLFGKFVNKVSPQSSNAPQRANNKRRRSLSEGSYTQADKLRAGNDGDNCPRPIDDRDDYDDSPNSRSSSMSAPTFTSLSSPATSYADPPDPKSTSTPRKTCKEKISELTKELEKSAEEIESSKKCLSQMNEHLDAIDRSTPEPTDPQPEKENNSVLIQDESLAQLLEEPIKTVVRRVINVGSNFIVSRKACTIAPNSAHDCVIGN